MNSTIAASEYSFSSSCPTALPAKMVISTQALTARADDVCADLRNQRNIGLNSLVDDRINFGKVIGQVALEVRQVFEHKTFSVDKTERGSNESV